MSVKTVKDEIDVDDVTESFEYVYLIQTIMFKNNKGHRICKFGKTSRLHTRFNGYPEGTRIYFIKRVKNCGFVEDEIKRLFKKYFISEPTYGREYFSGEVGKMIECIEKIIEASDQEIEDKEVRARIRSYYRNKIIMAIGKHDTFDDPYFDDESMDEIIEEDAGKNIVDNDPLLENETLDQDSTGYVEETKVTESEIVKKKKNISNTSCDKCNKVFATSKGLTYHKEHNSCKVCNHNCRYCAKKFTSANSMYRHMRDNCQVKKQQDVENEKKSERLSELEENNKKLIKSQKNVLSENKKLKSEIENLKKEKKIVKTVKDTS